MNRTQRQIFFTASLVLIITGLVLLAYVFWPLPHLQIIGTAPATMFVLPP